MQVFSRLLRRAEPIRPILFIHLPKTAGTSFRVSLIRSIGKSKLCFDYRGASQLLSPEVRRFMINSECPHEFRRAFDQKGYFALSGHFNASRYAASFTAESVISFVRDPVEYVYSAYRHAMRDGRINQTFEQYVRNPKNQNRQSRLVCSECWPSFGVVGVTERFSESLDVINLHFDILLREKRLNVDEKHRKKKSAGHDIDIGSEEFVSYIREVNSLDVCLYQTVNTLLDKRIESIRSGASFIRGGYRINNGFELFGKIAFDSVPNGACQIEILRGGERVLIKPFTVTDSSLAEKSFSYDLREYVDGGLAGAGFWQGAINVNLHHSEGVSPLIGY